MDGTANSSKVRLSVRVHSVTNKVFTGRKGGSSEMFQYNLRHAEPLWDFFLTLSRVFEIPIVLVKHILYEYFIGGTRRVNPSRGVR